MPYWISSGGEGVKELLLSLPKLERLYVELDSTGRIRRRSACCGDLIGNEQIR